jgi:hypothetical protein
MALLTLMLTLTLREIEALLTHRRERQADLIAAIQLCAYGLR